MLGLSVVGVAFVEIRLIKFYAVGVLSVVDVNTATLEFDGVARKSDDTFDVGFVLVIRFVWWMKHNDVSAFRRGNLPAEEILE